MSEVVTYSIDLYRKTRDRLEALMEQSGMAARDFLSTLVASYETNQAYESMEQVRDLEILRHHLAWMKEIFNPHLKEINDLKINDNFAAEMEEILKRQAAGFIAEVKNILQKVEEKTILAMECLQRELAVTEAIIKDLEARVQEAKTAAKAGQCCQEKNQHQKQAEKQVTTDCDNNAPEVCTHVEDNNTTAAGDSSYAKGNHKTTSGPASHVEGEKTLELANSQLATIIGAVLIALSTLLITAGQALAGAIILLTGVTIALL